MEQTNKCKYGAVGCNCDNDFELNSQPVKIKHKELFSHRNKLCECFVASGAEWEGNLLKLTIPKNTLKPLTFEEANNLIDFVHSLLAYQKATIKKELVEFIEVESGKSGRQEIIKFIKNL